MEEFREYAREALAGEIVVRAIGFGTSHDFDSMTRQDVRTSKHLWTS